MATILETLQNAEYNLVTNRAIRLSSEIGRAQLTNAVRLLEKGYPLNTDVEDLLEDFKDVDNVPDYLPM